jgi:hypothetical protein
LHFADGGVITDQGIVVWERSQFVVMNLLACSPHLKARRSLDLGLGALAVILALVLLAVDPAEVRAVLDDQVVAVEDRTCSVTGLFPQSVRSSGVR